MMQGLKNRTRKALGLRKRDKDSDSTSSPDKEGSGSGGKKGSKKANGAPNGFYGEIDWDRYASPDVDEEGFSLRPGEEGETSRAKQFFSSSESEDEEESRRKFKIKIKPLVSESVKCVTPSVDELKASVGGLALSPALKRSPRRSPGQMKRNLSCEEIARPRRSTPTPSPAPDNPIDRLNQNVPTFFGLPPESSYPTYDVVPGDAWGESSRPQPEAFSRGFPMGAPPPLPPKNIPSTSHYGYPSDPSVDLPKGGGVSRSSAPIYLNIHSPVSYQDSPDEVFGPGDSPQLSDDAAASRWVTFGSERPPPPEEPAPPPPPPESPPPDTPSSTPSTPGLSPGPPPSEPPPSPPPFSSARSPPSPPAFSHPSPRPFSPGSPPPFSRQSPPPFSHRSPPPFSRQSPLPFSRQSPPPFSRQSPPSFTHQSPLPFSRHSPPPFSPKSPPLFSTKSPPPFSPKSPPIFSTKSPPPFSTRSPPPFSTKSPPPFSPKSSPPFSPPDSPPSIVLGPPPDEPAPPLPPDFSPSDLPPVGLDGEEAFDEEVRELARYSSPPAPTSPVPPLPAERWSPWRPGVPSPLVLGGCGKRTPDAAFLRDDLPDAVGSPREMTPGFRGTPPPLPPTTYRSIMSSPGPYAGSSPSSPARPAAPHSAGSPVPPPPPPRPSSRPKLPPGRPMADLARPFSPPVSASPPPFAPLARAESSSSISSVTSMSAASTPTLGRELLSNTECYQPLVWFDNGRFYLAFEGSSRGPSPLTMGFQDTLPVAAAFTETINAYFKGADPSKCVVKITGEIVLSFPAGITRHFASQPTQPVLSFSISNYHRLEQVLPNPQLLCCDSTTDIVDSKEFWVNMQNLMSHLKRVAEQKPQATYYNVDMIKYQVATEGIHSTPLNLALSWRGDPGSTDLRIDYKYNSQAMAAPAPLHNIHFLVPVDGGVAKLQAMIPPATWNHEQQTILWKIPSLSPRSENGGVGALLGRFQLTGGPSKPSQLAVQFTSEGSTLSGCDIQLVGSGYRLSLVKKRFAAGKYLADN